MAVGGRGGSIDGVGGSLQTHAAQGQPGWKKAELSGSLERGPGVQALVTFLAQLIMVITREYAVPGEGIAPPLW